MMRRVGRWLVWLLLLGGERSAGAALDPGVTQPYQLQIVLLPSEHRMLTPLLQDRLTRTIRDELRQRLGKLAEVEVIQRHPLTPALQARGLAAVETWEETSDRQTHFLLLDYENGRYILQARGHYGWTSVVGAATHRAVTGDREAVAQLAVELIEKSFAPAGTVTQVGEDVEVTLRGGQLGSFARWLQTGDVMAVSRMVRQGQSLRATPLPWTLLEVTTAPRDGVVRCKLWRRFQQDDLQGDAGSEGYRAQVLATVQAPVRIRFLDEETGRPLDGLQIYVTQPGSKKKVETSTDRNGLAATNERFSRWALVQVTLGTNVLAQLPVELVADRTVVCRLKAQPEAEALAGLELRRDQWLRRIYDQLRVATERVPELNLLLSRSLEAALEHAQRGAKQLDHALDQLRQEKELLARLARQHEAKGRIDLQEGEQRLAELDTRRQELGQFIQRIEKVMQEAKSEKTQALAKLLERARLLEREAEFEQAIQLYEQVLDARPDQEAVAAQLEKLRARWKTKNPAHAKAREFLLQTWPRLEPRELGSNLAEAEKALAALREADDRLTPRRVLKANTLHVSRLKDRLETLRRQNDEDSRNQLQTLAKTAEGLRDFHAQTSALAKE